MKKTFTSLCAGLLLGIVPSLAVPAPPYPIEMTQPDGTIIAIQLVGDEYAHYEMTADGIPVVRGEDNFFYYGEYTASGELKAGTVIARNADVRTEADLAYLATLPDKQAFTQKFETRRSVAQRGVIKEETSITAQQWMTPMGSNEEIVILVQFQDVQFTHTQTDFYNLLNQEGYSENGATGSVRDYFVDQSGGKYSPTYKVVGPITLSNNQSYYGADTSGRDTNAKTMVEEACTQVNSLVDFSNYDYNGDGEVDLVHIIYAGHGQNYTGVADDIWPMRAFTSSTGTWDGKKIDMYVRTAELSGSSSTSIDGIGTFIHETSHAFGLPDWYDTSGGSCPGMGSWSVMHSGCYNNSGHTPVNYTAYERAFCGWMSLTELPSTEETISLGNLADTQMAYSMTSSDTKQYFVLENRQKTGWDAYMASSGLLIYKVDYDEYSWYWDTPNTNADRPRMVIVPADNSYSTEAGDLYPYNGNNTFTSTSTPASVTNTAGTIDRPITYITQSNGLISFLVNNDGTYGVPEITTFGKSGDNLTVRWTSVPGAEMYKLRIERQSLSGGTIELFKEVTTPDLEYSTWNVSIDGYVYTAKVRAQNTDGDVVGAYSPIVSVTIGTALPYAITYSSAENGTFEILEGTETIASGTEVLAGTTLTVSTTPDAGYQLDKITVNGNEISGNTFILVEETTVVVTFKEKGSEPVQYTTPSGTMHSNSYTYVERIYTENATKDVEQNWTSKPDNVYQMLDETLSVKPGQTFNLHLDAYSLGDYSESTTRQDLRYDAAVIFVDWDGDAAFEQLAKIGSTPPSDNIGGNAKDDANNVMTINQEIAVPTDATLGECRIRVIYCNAWKTNSGEFFATLDANTQNIVDGMAYDIQVVVANEGGTTAEYQIPSGAMHSNSYTYVERIYTENATKDVDQSWTSKPDNVYQMLDEPLSVKPGQTFNLHLDAYSLGDYSESTTRQDLRYDAAVIFVDWEGDATFEQLVQIGSVPPSDHIGGNIDVLTINQEITVPTDVTLGECRIRVIYCNAWQDGDGQFFKTFDANTQNIVDGMAYDIQVVITNETAIFEMESADRIYAGQGQIVVECEGEQPIEVINITGQVILSTTVNGRASLNVPTRGIYIVRCGSQVARVIVQ